jgi:arylmalonate decarboxylase
MTPTIGMIVPPAAGEVPPEARALYPSGVNFVAEGLGLVELTPQGYDGVIDKVGDLSIKLRERGATAVALMGTSLSFYRGLPFSQQLVATMQRASGLRATTMSAGVVNALRALGARKVALGTAYGAAVNDRLREFLTASGFTVAGLASLDIVDVEAVFSVTEEMLLDLGDRAFQAGAGADALFISCGGLRTLNVTLPLEQRHRLPVVSSSTAGVWQAMQLIGHDARVPGHGQLLGLSGTL